MVLGPGGVDEAATAARRREMRAAGRAPVAFEYGAERRSYESTMSEEFQDLVASVLAEEPPASRLYLRDILYERRLAGSAPQDRAGLERIIAELGRATTSPLLPRRRGRGKG